MSDNKKKLVTLDLLEAIAKGLNDKAKDIIQAEENRSLAAEQALLNKIDKVELMLGGRSIKYVLQEQFDALSEEEKNDPTITYFITNAEEIVYVTPEELQAFEERMNAKLAQKADKEDYLSEDDINDIIAGLDE